MEKLIEALVGLLAVGLIVWQEFRLRAGERDRRDMGAWAGRLLIDRNRWQHRAQALEGEIERLKGGAQ